jgi:hypothetical protein
MGPICTPRATRVLIATDAQLGSQLHPLRTTTIFAADGQLGPLVATGAQLGSWVGNYMPFCVVWETRLQGSFEFLHTLISLCSERIPFFHMYSSGVHVGVDSIFPSCCVFLFMYVNVHVQSSMIFWIVWQQPLIYFVLLCCYFIHYYYGYVKCSGHLFTSGSFP